jgi:hypothetical protein
MRLFGFLAILLFSFADTAWSQSSCRGVESRIQERATYIKEKFKDKDVSTDVEYVEKLATTCNVNIAKFGWGRGLFDYWKNTGYEAELDKAKEQIEHYSKYRDVSPEIEKFKNYSAKLKADQSEVNKYSSYYTGIGKKSGSSEAKKCQPSVDMRNSALGDVRDQDSVGWCYAFAGSDLLTYKLGKKISPADIAMNNNDGWVNNLFKKAGWGEQDFDIGWASSAIEATKAKGGACLEASLRSEDNGYSSLFSTLEEINKSKKNTSSPSSFSCVSAVKSIFPNLAPREIQEAVDKLGRTELLNMLSDKACKPRLNIAGLKTQSHSAIFESGRNQLFDEIDKQFSKKNIVAIAYNANSLYDKDTKSFGFHESVLVGRRYNQKNGECEYLVRNSWGRGCSSYDSYFDCEQGNIWVPKSVLVKGLRNVEYVE